MSYSIVKTSCYSKAEAKLLAKMLLSKKLVACAQISKVKSFYSWEGKIQKDQEMSVVVCSRRRQAGIRLRWDLGNEHQRRQGEETKQDGGKTPPAKNQSPPEAHEGRQDPRQIPGQEK